MKRYNLEQLEHNVEGHEKENLMMWLTELIYSNVVTATGVQNHSQRVWATLLFLSRYTKRKAIFISKPMFI